MSATAFRIAGQRIYQGERKIVALEVARLYDFTEMKIPVQVIRGTRPGPTLFVCAAIHGDEVNGVEIVKRLLQHPSLKKISGTLIAVPVVNVFGFNIRSRYLPDRRDLNRSFPGSQQGSLAARLADVFLNEIVKRSSHGVDLHTGSLHRSNIPQVRASLEDQETRRLAESFSVPVILNSSLRDGSLRQVAADLNIPTLLFEGGQALRFEESVIQVGLRGVLSMMKEIGMIHRSGYEGERRRKAFWAKSSHWVRAPQSGLFTAEVGLGKKVKKNQLLATITNVFGEHLLEVRASHSGLVIGQALLPMVNRGDALFHVATFEDLGQFQEGEDWWVDEALSRRALDL